MCAHLIFVSQCYHLHHRHQPKVQVRHLTESTSYIPLSNRGLAGGPLLECNQPTKREEKYSLSLYLFALSFQTHLSLSVQKNILVVFFFSYTVSVEPHVSVPLRFIAFSSTSSFPNIFNSAFLACSILHAIKRIHCFYNSLL